MSSFAMMPAATITVSCARDLAINCLALPELLRQVPAKRHILIVPESDVRAFASALPSAFEIVAEDDVLVGWDLGAVRRRLPEPVQWRAGWYYQQLLKLQALAACARDSEALLWDGDTLPLRPLEFKDARGFVRLYTARERHLPYFATTQRLLGLDKAVRESFIAQCMYVRHAWIEGMLHTIEERTGRSWLEAILESVTGSSPSEFSEYETLGTYVMHRHRGEAQLTTRRWFRWGTGYFGSLARLDERRLARLAGAYDFVAFERWDRGASAWLRSRRVLLTERLGRRVA